MADLPKILGRVICTCGHEWTWQTQAEWHIAARARNDAPCSACGHRALEHAFGGLCYGAAPEEPICECPGFACSGHAERDQ